MLARRFTLVCLVAAMLGMLFASLVARIGSPSHEERLGRVVSCPVEGTRCIPQRPS